MCERELSVSEGGIIGHWTLPMYLCMCMYLYVCLYMYACMYECIYLSIYPSVCLSVMEHLPGQHFTGPLQNFRPLSLVWHAKCVLGTAPVYQDDYQWLSLNVETMLPTHWLLSDMKLPKADEGLFTHVCPLPRAYYLMWIKSEFKRNQWTHLKISVISHCSCSNPFLPTFLKRCW